MKETDQSRWAALERATARPPRSVCRVFGWELVAMPIGPERRIEYY